MGLNYFKIAWRQLQKQKSNTIVNILGLALGLTVCLLIMLYVSEELSYDRFYPQAEQIFRVKIDLETANGTFAYATTPPALAHALKTNFPQVRHVARVMTQPETVIKFEDKKFNENRIFRVDPDFFRVFETTFLPGSSQSCLNHPNSIVITETMARKYFGSLPPAGQLLDFGFAQFEVTAVVQDVPSNSHFKYDFLLSLQPFQAQDWLQNDWETVDGQQGLFYTYLKLQPDINPEIFQMQLKSIRQHYQKPSVESTEKRQSYALQHLHEIHLHSRLLNELEPPGNAVNVMILALVAGLILIIACLNFINLTNAQAVKRTQEIGIRKAMGAKRSQLIWQFLGESFLLIGVAFILTLALIEFSLPFFNQLIGKQLDFALGRQPVLLVELAGIFIIVGLVAAGYPAFYMASFQPTTILRPGVTKLVSKITFRRAAIIFQFVASMGLIIGSIIIYRQTQFMKNADLGFAKAQLLVLPVPMGALFRPNTEETVRNEFTEHHSVLSATSTSAIPGKNQHLFKGEVRLVNEAAAASQTMNIMMVDHDFFETYQVRLMAGRTFNRTVTTDAQRACLINEAAVKAFGWHSAQAAVGKRVADMHEAEIIGVFQNFHVTSLQQPIEPMMLTINPDFFVYITLKIETDNLAETLAFVKQKWQTLFPGEPFSFQFFDDIFDRLYRDEEILGQIIQIFTLLVIAISSLGLFGLASLLTEQRTREVGIRKVLGSSVWEIALLFLNEFTRSILLAGLIAAPLVYFIMKRWLQNFAWHIHIEWWIFPLAGALTLLVAWLSVGFQAIKAARLNPVETLRYE